MSEILAPSARASETHSVYHYWRIVGGDRDLGRANQLWGAMDAAHALSIETDIGGGESYGGFETEVFTRDANGVETLIARFAPGGRQTYGSKPS